MSPRARRRLVFLAVFAAFGAGACTIVTAPPPAAGPPPASGPPPVAAAPAPAESRYEDDTWRPGGDLRTFDLRQGGAEACAAACEKEPACIAYSYRKAEHASHGVGECALKHNVPMASKSPCRISGVIRPWPWR